MQEIFLLFAVCTARACAYLYKLESWGELYFYSARFVLLFFQAREPVTSLRLCGVHRRGDISVPNRFASKPTPRRVPLAIWCLAQLARAVRICMCDPLKHSFLKRAVANRTAHKLFSLLRFDIQGDYPISVSNRSIFDCTSLDRQRYGFDA